MTSNLEKPVPTAKDHPRNAAGFLNNPTRQNRKKNLNRFWLIPFLVFVWLSFLFQFATAETTILILGDSLTAGYGVEKEQAFPYLVEQQLKSEGYQDVRVINGGFSGSTTASAFNRLKWYLKIKPDILLLELGANDGLRGHKIEAIRQNLGRTIEFARSKGMKVLLAGMQMPRNYGKQYTEQFKRLFREVADAYDIPLIPFLLEGVAGRKDLNLADGIHPNPQGHRIVARNVAPYLISILEE